MAGSDVDWMDWQRKPRHMAWGIAQPRLCSIRNWCRDPLEAGDKNVPCALAYALTRLALPRTAKAWAYLRTRFLVCTCGVLAAWCGSWWATKLSYDNYEIIQDDTP